MLLRNREGIYFFIARYSHEHQGLVHSLIFLFAIDNINQNPDILPNITLGSHLYDTCLDGRLVISYGASDPFLSDRLLYPYVFQMVQNNHIHNMAITELLEHFGWTWVGIIVSGDETGENELRILTKYMKERGICAAFTIKLTGENYKKHSNEWILHILSNSQITIIVMCGVFDSFLAHLTNNHHSVLMHKTLILPPSWVSGSVTLDHSVFNGSLAVDFSSQPIPGLEYFVKNCKKHLHSSNYIKMWGYLNNLLRRKDKNVFLSFNYTDEEKQITSYSVPSLRYFLLSGVSPRLYTAVEVLAKALHEMFLFIKDKYEENSVTGFLHYRWKLHRYIQMMKSSPDPMRPSYYFNDQGEAGHPYKINNLYIDKDVHEVEVGNFTPWATSGEKLYINTQSIRWKHTMEIPVSRCSDQCSPGSRKKTGETIHTCCYNCVPCSEGEISNVTDAANCIKCQSDEWPNEKRDQCLPKVIEFISHQNDTMASIFSGVSVFGCLVTIFIFGIFISYQDTPIVKANNRNMSYLLLVSIILSFLSIFLFLGQPSDVTCSFRETSFGVFFSVAISSLIAKTVMDLDKQSYPEKIIIQCNVGSDICFYSMLGYMGFLAAVSFVLAFMVRTLPDSFNEAKYITFSMLLFCSVWISMIPAYLSTKGKNMVAVEIFAVLDPIEALSNQLRSLAIEIAKVKQQRLSGGDLVKEPKLDLPDHFSGDESQKVGLVISRLQEDPQVWAFSLPPTTKAFLSVESFFSGCGFDLR
ncbi:vomeronasal type-2 receptor 26-like [Eleutherodactylus coqui]|uniref:vomeronasal type-2 receptor 26-like n=1 Tax=Eleutherodactylus coqui TaxID=57060 RepID=UPI003461B229